MIIPIVRRTVTVRVRDAFRFPFQCDVCRLSTWATAWAEGVGSATMAYLSPDANVARHRAYQAAQASAASAFGQCPCPRCGSHGWAQRARLGAFEKRVVSRKQVRFWILIVGLALSTLWAGGCGAAMIADEGWNGDTVGGATMLALMCACVGLVITGIAWACAGPGARPVLLPYIPPNVQFDPPDASQVEGSYRAA